MKTRAWVIYFFGGWMLVLPAKAAGPSDEGFPAEISPGNYLSVDVEHSVSGPRNGSWWQTHVFPGRGKASDSVILKFVYQGRTMTWYGNSLPVCLREHDSMLYLATFDRITHKTAGAHFRYFRQKEASFEEIESGLFPRAIAGNNMMFGQRYIVTAAGEIDKIQVERDQDPQNVHFRDSMTARLWDHLSTGKQYYQSRGNGVSPQVLKDYLNKYKPSKLTYARLLSAPRDPGD